MSVEYAVSREAVDEIIALSPKGRSAWKSVSIDDQTVRKIAVTHDGHNLTSVTSEEGLDADAVCQAVLYALRYVRDRRSEAAKKAAATRAARRFREVVLNSSQA